MTQPKDPSKFHFYVSLIKSAIRIAAGTSLIYFTPATGVIAAGVLLVAAEVLGIIEEL